MEELFLTARRGSSEEVLAALVQQPALITAREPDSRRTLLHVFASLSDHAAVARLLALGADTEERDAHFRSALHSAARADALPQLPAAGAASACAGEPRAAAVEATLRELLLAGARVSARDQFGFTALHHAAQAGHTEAVSFLLGLNTTMSLPRAPLEAETNAEERPLHLAAGGGHAATVRRLLEHGAHPDKSNYQGRTPLHLASLLGLDLRLDSLAELSRFSDAATCRSLACGCSSSCSRLLIPAGDDPRALATVRELCAEKWRARR